MRRGTVSLPKGLWKKNTLNGSTANALVSDSLTDLGHGACFNDARVEVTRMITAQYQDENVSLWISETVHTNLKVTAATNRILPWLLKQKRLPTAGMYSQLGISPETCPRRYPDKTDQFSYLSEDLPMKSENLEPYLDN